MTVLESITTIQYVPVRTLFPGSPSEYLWVGHAFKDTSAERVLEFINEHNRVRESWEEYYRLAEIVTKTELIEVKIERTQ